MACKERGLASRVVGFGRNRDNLEKARKLNIVDDYTTDLREAVKGSDLIVLCSPVGSFKQLAEGMAASLQAGVIVTDVGSVKGPMVRELEKIIPSSVSFVGGHPIAGGEKSGIGAADKDLYCGAKCIITPTPNTDKAAQERVASLWETVGMNVCTMDADEHDYIFGAVSHLPHVIAFALMNTVAEIKTANYDQITFFAGSGLKDVTRIAASDPVMWRDICVANKSSILSCLGLYQETLAKIKASIEQGDGKSLERMFSVANKHRLAMCEKTNDHSN